MIVTDSLDNLIFKSTSIIVPDSCRQPSEFPEPFFSNKRIDFLFGFVIER